MGPARADTDGEGHLSNFELALAGFQKSEGGVGAMAKVPFSCDASQVTGERGTRKLRGIV
jgi:hypothetical protein